MSRVSVDLPALSGLAIHRNGEMYIAKSSLLLWLTDTAEALDHADVNKDFGTVVRAVRDGIKSARWVELSR